MDSTFLLWIMLTVVMIIAAFAIERYRMTKAEAILDQWAYTKQYTLLSKEYRRLRTGPFFIRSSNSQMVYRITIYDPGLQMNRTGWARIGGWFFGLLNPEINVIWD